MKSTDELHALAALAEALGDDDDTWTASGRLVVMSDGDVVAKCSGSLGAMPEPFDADQAARFIAAAYNSTRELVSRVLKAETDAVALRKSLGTAVRCLLDWEASTVMPAHIDAVWNDPLAMAAGSDRP